MGKGPKHKILSNRTFIAFGLRHSIGDTLLLLMMDYLNPTTCTCSFLEAHREPKHLFLQILEGLLAWTLK